MLISSFMEMKREVIFLHTYIKDSQYHYLLEATELNLQVPVATKITMDQLRDSARLMIVSDLDI